MILVDANDKEIANILIVALPSYLREDEGRVRIKILRDGRYTPYWVPSSNHRESNRPRLKNS